MDKVPQPTARLWTFLWEGEGMWAEGMRLFFGYWRSWIVGAFLFVVATVMVETCTRIVPDDPLWLVVGVLLQCCEVYFFCVCFLHQEPVSGSVRPDKRTFARALIYIAAMAFALIGVTMVITFTIDSIVSVVEGDPAARLKWLNRAVCVVWWLWAGGRVLCLAPFVVNGFKDPARRSLLVTQGKLTRLIANYLVLVLLAMPFFLILYLTGSHLLGDMIQVVMLGIHTAFACAACRILNGEHIAATLGFERRVAKRD